jgi:hypothetical protein
VFQLFDIQAREGQARGGGFDGEGVFYVGREAAGSVRGRDALLAAEPFDLCVIDEAHEVFAGIYKRFDKFGVYNDDAPQARTAGRLQARRELVDAIGTRYRTAARCDKRQIFDEFAAVTGYHRRHAIRNYVRYRSPQLRGPSMPSRVSRGSTNRSTAS